MTNTTQSNYLDGTPGTNSTALSVSGGTGGVGYTTKGGSLNTTTNIGDITGGVGGGGGPGSAVSPAGGGGSGGVGVLLTAGTLVNSVNSNKAGYPFSGRIYGGGGGIGGYNPSNDVRGTGGVGGVGVEFASSGTLHNQAGAYIVGGSGGRGQESLAGNDVKGGGGGGGIGVLLSANSTLFNDSDATIIGGYGGGEGGLGGPGGNGGTGVSVANGVLLNSGAIRGGVGASVSAFGDSTAGNGGAGVYLNGGVLVTYGTISGGTGGKGFATYEPPGLEGDAVQFGSSAGKLEVGAGAIFNGQVAANGSVADTLELIGTESGGTGITLGTQFTGFQTLDFATGAAWTVDAASGAAPASDLTITGFAVGDTIDITNLKLSTVAADQSGNTFSTADGAFDFSGIPVGDSLVLSSANGGAGTDITLIAGPVCYLRGTRIRTETGDKAVEDLTVGECVLSASGQSRAIRWLGHRSFDCTRYPDPAVVWPIRIQAGAFAENQPSRDLWVSPGHSILIGGVLIQAEKLVNGATIAQMRRERVEYWHVELDSHDILLAEGLPAESYLDTGNRTSFVNGGAYLEAYPDFAPKHWRETCAPLVLEGPEVQRARAALVARAEALGYARTDDPDLHLLADGQRIDPVRLAAQRVAFMLPAGRSTIELRCRSFTPAEIDSDCKDHRSLGVCVSRLQLDGVEVALQDELTFSLGWHVLEGKSDEQHRRWSQYRMPLPSGTRLLVLDLRHEGQHYWTKSESSVLTLFG